MTFDLQKKDLFVYGLLFISTLFLLGIGVYFNYDRALVPNDDTPTKILKVEGLLINEGTLQWQTYVNKKYSFAFAYPPEWKLGRDRETISSYPFQSVTIDSGNTLGTQIFDMQVQLRNTGKMPVLDLVRSFGSPRQYTDYGTIGGVPAIVSAPPHGHSTTINFTSGEYFFNVDVNNIDAGKLREIFDTFAFSTSSSNSGELKPSMVPLAPSVGTCTLATSKKSQAKEYDDWNIFIDKDHCLGFMYPPQWMMGDTSAFPAFPPPVFDETSHSRLFQHDTEIGKEMLLLNMVERNPDRVPIEELLPTLRIRDEYKHYGTIANVEAVITVTSSGAIIRFTKGTYLFELYVKGISLEMLTSIIDTFVVLLPEPLPPQPKESVATTSSEEPSPMPAPLAPPPPPPPVFVPTPTPPPPPPSSSGCERSKGCIIEDAGKRNVEHLPEVEALRKKYGEERLFIKALDRHLVGRETQWHTNHAAMKEHDDLLYAVRPDWDPKITGCVIVVYAGGEGFVYQEDKELNVISTETLAEFLDHTKNVPPEMMYRFFLSLH